MLLIMSDCIININNVGSIDIGREEKDYEGKAVHGVYLRWTDLAKRAPVVGSDKHIFAGSFEECQKFLIELRNSLVKQNFTHLRDVEIAARGE